MKIRDYINKDSVMLGLEVNSAEDVIRLLGGKLRTLGYVKEDFIKAALERELNMPTGLPLGGEYNAAIPHVDIEYVNQSALGLATLKNEVVFKNMIDHNEDVPCKLVLMLALDQPKSQIEMLQSVAALLQDADTVSKLVSAKTSDEVFSILA